MDSIFFRWLTNDNHYSYLWIGGLVKICFLGMLLCWTLRKLSNIFTLETARYIREYYIVFGDKFSNKLNSCSCVKENFFRWLVPPSSHLYLYLYFCGWLIPPSSHLYLYLYFCRWLVPPSSHFCASRGPSASLSLLNRYQVRILFWFYLWFLYFLSDQCVPLSVSIPSDVVKT